jgi:hypothetical protein
MAFFTLIFKPRPELWFNFYKDGDQIRTQVVSDFGEGEEAE